MLEEIRKKIDSRTGLQIRKEDVYHMREAFCSAIASGERKLYRFTQELIDSLLDCPIALIIDVWGRCPCKEHKGIQKTQVKLGESFGTLQDRYTQETSFDSYLANHFAPICWCGEKTVSIASFVKAVAERENPFGIRMISTRIKTPSNIAYKVADILFDIDRMFRRDKIMNLYSQTIKDVYGVKIITKDLNSLQKTIRWFKGFPRHELLETKDYLGSNKKRSGFEAYKLIIQRPQQLFEVQLQTEAMLERETLGLRENHQTYKEKQLRMRAKLGKRYIKVYNTLQVLLCSSGTYCRDLAV